MAEVILNDLASALMHSAAFPEYPVRGIDRTIAFHLRSSPALRVMLLDVFDRFPFTGLSLLVLKNASRDAVARHLEALADVPGLDEPERARRVEPLAPYRRSPGLGPVDLTALSMTQRR